MMSWGQAPSSWAAGEDAFQFLEEEATVVTASKKEEKIQDAPGIVTVITADQIRRFWSAEPAGCPGPGPQHLYHGLLPLPLQYRFHARRRGNSGGYARAVALKWTSRAGTGLRRDQQSPLDGVPGRSHRSY